MRGVDAINEYFHSKEKDKGGGNKKLNKEHKTDKN
jgi:hypothetical protein